jgi:2-polyprenyl-3-methyl-5-hydroxy-6-metoxy-1,4-benzoquinol methylase
LYSGHYVDATYGDRMRQTFDRIIRLPPERSDNFGRVRRINDFFGSSVAGRTVLDVGSGLCVFLHAMKVTGWDGTALDPDPRAAQHAREVVGVEAVQGDFMSVDPPGCFDLLTFNKVLEHVKDPVSMLARGRHFLRPGGFVYVELPDAELAFADGAGREEFFIDHHHIFSAASFAVLAQRAGYHVSSLARLQEPSTKYTLWAFLRAA